MKVRHYQILDVGIVLVFMGVCVQSVLLGNDILSWMSLVATGIMTASITVGLFLAAYILITKSQIFDPLSSELDDDPEA
jgi:hypothetical protein